MLVDSRRMPDDVAQNPQDRRISAPPQEHRRSVRRLEHPPNPEVDQIPTGRSRRLRRSTDRRRSRRQCREG